MPGNHDNIRAKRPSLVGWEVINIIVTRMKCIVGIIFLNQCSDKRHSLPEHWFRKMLPTMRFMLVTIMLMTSHPTREGLFARILS